MTGEKQCTLSASSHWRKVFNHQKRQNEPLLPGFNVKDTVFRYTWRKATAEVPKYITTHGFCNPALPPFLYCITKKPEKFSSNSARISSNDTFLERRVWFSLWDFYYFLCFCWLAAMLCNFVLLFFPFSKIAFLLFSRLEFLVIDLSQDEAFWLQNKGKKRDLF